MTFEGEGDETVESEDEKTSDSMAEWNVNAIPSGGSLTLTTQLQFARQITLGMVNNIIVY